MVNGSLDRNTDTKGGTRRSTRVAKALAEYPTTALAKTPVVRIVAGAVGALDSTTATAVTATTHLTTPQGYFSIQLWKIT